MLRNILLIDNFDSFTYNLVDFFRRLGCSVKVYRNTVNLDILHREEFDLLVLSPGPSVPRNAGNLMSIIDHFYRSKPILGVCLGHQALVEFFGGTLQNIAPVHGKAEAIDHDGRSIFTGLEPGMRVARYHSWAAGQIPTELEVSARAADGTVMAIRHKRLPIEGIQFHPESVLSMTRDAGIRLLQNVVQGRLSTGNQVFHTISSRLQSGNLPDVPLLQRFLQSVEEGQLSEEQKQILLVALSIRLRDAEALTAFVEAISFPAIAGEQVDAVDICGTGGSGLPRINTSTLVSLLLAHCGLPVAKHGNRAAAGRFGSFDLLETLGVPIRFDAKKVQRTLEETNLAFLFAPDIYPVFRHLALLRSKIGVPTVFNILGPLLNPLQPRRQFIGTAFTDMMDVLFETGIRMNKEHLIVVRSLDGLDEISVSSPTRVLEYRNGQQFEFELKPTDFGLEPLQFGAVSAANSGECLAIAQAMLAGVPTTEHYKLVAANAAFIYTRFVEDIPLKTAFLKMEKLIFAGVMGEVLQRYKAVMTKPEHILVDALV